MTSFIPVQRLNHAVLYVSDLARAASFYERVFGFERVAEQGPMVFLRAQGSSNHHDLGLLSLGAQARPAPAGSTGLYHLAWQVDSIHTLRAARDILMKENALRGESDHGATKSLYAEDPDGNEFEVMTLLPQKEWGVYAKQAPVQRLNWEKELSSNLRDAKADGKTTD